MANVNTFSAGPFQGFLKGGVYGALSVSTTPAVAKVSTDNFTGRNVVVVYNSSTSGTLYWGFDSSVSGSSGVGIPPENTAVFNVTDAVNIYLVTAAGTIDARIAEGY